MYSILNQVNGVKGAHQNGLSSEIAMSASPAPATAMSLLETPPDAFNLLAEKGKSNAKASTAKILVSAMLGGAYVGMGK